MSSFLTLCFQRWTGVRGSDVFDALAYGDGEEVILGLAELVKKGSADYRGITNILTTDGHRGRQS